MVVTAKVTVNTKRVEGKVSENGSEKILKSLLSEFKNVGNILSKALKLGQSGFSGLGGIGSAGLGKFLAGGAATLPALLGGLAGGMTGDTTQQYAKVRIDGEEYIGKINEKTGEIEELMTKEEAQQRGIVNKKGDIDAKLKASNDTLEDIAGEENVYKDIIDLTKDEAYEILAESEKEKLMRRAINDLLKKKKEALENELDLKQEIEESGYSKASTRRRVLDMGMGPISEEYALQQLNSQVNQRQQDPIINEAIRSKLPSFGYSDYLLRRQ